MLVGDGDEEGDDDVDQEERVHGQVEEEKRIVLDESDFNGENEYCVEEEKENDESPVAKEFGLRSEDVEGDGDAQALGAVFELRHEKSGEESNSDQRVHMDYGNNTFIHPPPWNAPNVVSIIIYYNDTAVTGGGTSIFPRQGEDDPWYQRPYEKMPGIGGRPFVNDRFSAEQMMEARGESRSSLYEREQWLSPGPGDVLFYRHDVWHRGTPVRPGKVRYVHNLAWRVKNSHVLRWNAGVTQWMYYGWLEKFIGEISYEALETIGFPSPDDDCWTQDMMECVQMRYAGTGFDVYCYVNSRGPGNT